MPGNGLGLIMHDLAPEIEAEFNRWYDDEYTPKLLAVPGVLTKRRYRSILGGPKYLSLSEIEDTSVPKRPEFWRVSALNPEADARSREMNNHFLNRIRGTYHCVLTLPDPEPTDLSRTRAVMVRGLDVDAEHQDELNDWLHTEHIPRLAAVPGLIRARRLRLDTTARDLIGNPPTFLNVYELEAAEVQEGEAWKTAAFTPWTVRIRRFYKDRMRYIYEPM